MDEGKICFHEKKKFQKVRNEFSRHSTDNLIISLPVQLFDDKLFA